MRIVTRAGFINARLNSRPRLCWPCTSSMRLLCFIAFVSGNFHLGASTSVLSSVCVTRFVPTPKDIWTSHLTNSSLVFSLGATAVIPSDPRYEDLRRQRNNLRYKCDAAYIALPKTAYEVVDILQRSLANSLRPTVRSGGHCYADYWTNNTGGVLIDLTGMNKIYRLPGDPIIWIEPGATVENAYSTVYREYGQWPPAGVCLDVAVGGHVLGGGYGYFARKFGLLSDYAYSFEVARVTADKRVELVVVSRNSLGDEANLYWALRGGGQQNFGIVTKIGFRDLPVPPPVIYTYVANYNLTSDLGELKFLSVLDKYLQFIVAHSAPGDEYCDLFTDMMVGRRLNGPYLMLRIVLFGEKQQLVDGFLDYVGLDARNFSCEKMSAYRLSLAAGYRDDYVIAGYYIGRSAYMVSKMPLYQIVTIWHYITHSNYSYIVDAFVQIRSYGCAVSHLPEYATAYPHRRAVIKIQYGTVWLQPEETDNHSLWSKSFYKAMYGQFGPAPDSVMDGCYVSYPDGDLVDAQKLYFKDNYERLRQVKAQWDPLDIFHHRQSVQLPVKSTRV